MQILFVVGLGVLGVVMIIGAILLLNKEESPAQRDKKVKNQIMAEMLDAATTEEERQRIMAMMDSDQLEETFGNDDSYLAAEEEQNLYGIDAESGDMLDVIIANQLQRSARAEQGDSKVESDVFAESEAAENGEYKTALFDYDNSDIEASADILGETMVIARDESLEDAEEKAEDLVEAAEEVKEEIKEEIQEEIKEFAAELLEDAAPFEEIAAKDAAQPEKE